MRAVELAEYDGIELWVETPYFWRRRYELISDLINYTDYIKAVHSAVIDLNPCSINSGIAEISIKEVLYSINVASILNSPLTIHAGKRSANRKPVEDDYISLDRYLRIVSNYSNIKGVRILLENSEPKINYLCKYAEEIEYFCKKYGFSFTFDINHAVKLGKVEDFLKLYNLIENLHVSGYDEEGRHVALDKSNRIIDILVQLEELGYDGLITIELDDLGYGKMSFEEKIEELKKERRILESVFKR